MNNSDQDFRTNPSARWITNGHFYNADGTACATCKLSWEDFRDNVDSAFNRLCKARKLDWFLRSTGQPSNFYFREKK